MSDDLVKRLRWAATLRDLTTASERDLMEEAAVRILELEAQLAEVRQERDQYLDEIIHLENGESM